MINFFGRPQHSELSNPIEANAPTKKDRDSHIAVETKVTYILEKYSLARDDKVYFYDKYESHFGAVRPIQVEGISRVWRKVQRDKPYLRGEKFYDRQKSAKKTAQLFASI